MNIIEQAIKMGSFSSKDAKYATTRDIKSPRKYVYSEQVCDFSIKILRGEIADNPSYELTSVSGLAQLYYIYDMGSILYVFAADGKTKTKKKHDQLLPKGTREEYLETILRADSLKLLDITNMYSPCMHIAELYHLFKTGQFSTTIPLSKLPVLDGTPLVKDDDKLVIAFYDGHSLGGFGQDFVAHKSSFPYFDRFRFIKPAGITVGGMIFKMGIAIIVSPTTRIVDDMRSESTKDITNQCQNNAVLLLKPGKAKSGWQKLDGYDTLELNITSPNTKIANDQHNKDQLKLLWDRVLEVYKKELA